MEKCLLRIATVVLLYVISIPHALASPQANAAAGGISPVPYPASNPYSAARAELGRKLFFDPRLSGSPGKICAACHHPGLGWADAMPQTRDGRHTPSLLNIGYATAFFWDGRAISLEDAVRQEMLSPGMADEKTSRDMVIRISALPAYRREFSKAFGSEEITFERMVAALATFIRGIVSNPGAFDRWQNGDRSAVPDDAKRGFLLFKGKAGCVHCHTGPAFTDSRFHNTGLNSIDPGYFGISGRKEDRNTFKTPGLRDVAITPPYMHNGSKSTLAKVIDFYNRGGDKIGAGNELMPLHLNRQEKQDLLAFLRSLTGKRKEITIPVLPVSTAFQNPVSDNGH